MTPRSPLEELAEIEREMLRDAARFETEMEPRSNEDYELFDKALGLILAWAARLAAARGALDGMLANERKEALADAARACIFNPPTLTAAVYDGFELGQAACIEQIRILKGRP